jgi:Ca2+-binding EF-hand superfamily protein
MTKVITAIYDLLGLFELFVVFIYLIIFYFLLGEENRKGDNSPDNRVKKIMEKLDLNDDKNISRDEFVEGCLKDDVLRQLLAPNV